jgi:hypothetical protein
MLFGESDRPGLIDVFSKLLPAALTLEVVASLVYVEDHDRRLR